MKTFKLVKLQIVEEEEQRSFDLIDGLIINKEDERRTWVLEAFLPAEHYDYFQDIQQRRGDLELLAVITSERNDPAGFYAHVHEVKAIGEKISVLFTGHIRNQRNEYAENLLSHLVENSELSGDELLDEFRQKMKERPRLKA